MMYDVEGNQAIDMFWVHGEVYFDNFEACCKFLQFICEKQNYAVEVEHTVENLWRVNKNYQ